MAHHPSQGSFKVLPPSLPDAPLYTTDRPFVSFFLTRAQADGALGQKLPPEEASNLQLLLKYTLNNAHYYCETADITRPFPSPHPVDSPSWQFVWNRWLAAALRAAGLGDHAPPLLQGVVEGKTVNDAHGRSLTVALLARRSRLHPGMRYIARGLNALASPGNEIECEQVVWTAGSDGCGWASYVWRRGTVPIWWGVELRQGGVGEADVVIPQHRPYRGVTRYFRRLQKRYMPDAQREAAIRAAAGKPAEAEVPEDRAVPVYCINLLRCNMTKRNGAPMVACDSSGIVCGLCVDTHHHVCVWIHTTMFHRAAAVGALCRGHPAPSTQAPRAASPHHQL